MSENKFLRSFMLCFGLLTVLSMQVLAEDQEVTEEAAPPPDEIVLKNGSRILGTVTGARDGVVSVDTDFAGTLSVDMAQIDSMHTQASITLLLADDTVVHSDTIKLGEQEVVVDTGEADTQTYAIDQLLVLNPEAWELGEGYKWTGLLSFAMAIERGNSDTDELDYKLETIWRSVEDRYTVKMNGEIDEANDQKNADNWNIIGKYDYFISDQTYWGANVFVESDEFSDLDLRYFVGPYIGREFLTESIFMLSAELGVSYVNEDFINAEDQEYPATNWSLNMSSDYLGGDSKLYLNQLGVWNLDETSDVIVNTSIGLSFPLLWNFEAAAEILWEYDSGAVEDVEDLDETYKFRIGYTW